MARTLYARSDVTAHFNPNCPTGGHARKVTNLKAVIEKDEAPIYGDDRLEVTCDVCEAELFQFVNNWTDKEDEVHARGTWTDNSDAMPLTKTEERAAKKAKEKGEAAMAGFSAALLERFQSAVATGELKL